MDQQIRMTRQMIDLQRMTINGMINNMIMFWDQTERTLNAFLEQAVWLPEDGKKAFRDWVVTNKKGCDSFRTTVDDGYNNVEKWFTGGERSQQTQ